MKTEILISCDEWENRVAVLEEGSLAEIYFEREEKVIGSIYKARVENVLPGMGACFVNIGLGRNAFLYVDDIMRDPINIGETEITDRRKGHTVNELLKVGGDVLVQIVKEPRGLKGARVSTNVSLPGRYLVLMPTGRYSGVSSKIEDANERARLKQILRRVRPEGMATIVRTAAQGVSEAELIADLGVQLRLWHGILESYKRASAPALLHKDLNLVFKAVRDFLTSDVSSVYIDSKEQYEAIRSTMSLLGPQYIDRLKLVDGPGTLFEARGVDEELQKLLKPKIPLPSGGHLVLEHTEALTVIDVNTGKFTGGRNLEDTIVKTNLEAATEIARQVRLRDIGGIIVVDFIDMARERSREQVIQTLTASLRRDRTRSTIQAFSNLGLLEFTRKRVGKDLAGQLRSECPYCTGLGTVMSSETLAIGVLRQIRGIASNGHRMQKLDVVCDASVATQLVGWYREELEKLAKDHNIEVGLFVDPLRHREHILVEESRRLRPAPQPGVVVEAELLPVRLPNPAAGVAVVNGYLVEVKDAANGSGQTVKIKIDKVESNFVQAELAEALQLGQRRRRRERGRARLAAEAPIAPPVPTLATLASAPRRGEKSEEPERARAQARLPRPRDVEPIFADEEEEAEEIPAAPQGSRKRGASAARRPEEYPEEQSARAKHRRGSPARSSSQQYPAPLVVGGEGDIDYEDDEEEATPAAASKAHPKAAEDESASAAAGRRRRRRRGRGKGGQAEVSGVRDVANGDEDGGDQDEDAIVVPARTLAPPITRRPAASANRYARDRRQAEDDDDLETVVEPRRADGPTRAPKRYGEVRQIYGRPAAREEREPREGRAPGSRAKEASPREYRQPKAPVRSAGRKPYGADELDVVVKPRAPAAIHVDVRPDMARRVGVHERERQQAPLEPRERSSAREEPPRTPERWRERPTRGRNENEGERERRPRGGRGAARPARPAGPAVKQLYPPPDQQDDFEIESDDSAATPRTAKKGRGPLMRPADAPPVPKGKVRQLYPPPEFEIQAAESEESETAQTSAEPNESFESGSSLFISDAEELEQRRLRARERAEARRRAEFEAQPDALTPESERPENRPVDDLPGNDEWPAF